MDCKLNVCYCQACHEARGEKRYAVSGDPPCRYALPLGWCQFALRWARELLSILLPNNGCKEVSIQDRRKFKLWHSILSFVSFRIPPRVESYHVFDKWHVAFYGTMIGRLRRILDLGDIPLQGKNSRQVPNPHHSFQCQTGDDHWTLRLACLVKSLSHFYWMFCFSSSRLVYFYCISQSVAVSSGVVHLTKKMKSLSFVCRPQSFARVKHKPKDKSKYLNSLKF